jgi:Domain of unknown function (DUF1992)
VSERKPPGVSFESWIDRQIREATERGEFDRLPGAGKPIPGAGQPDDELWWVRDFVRREGLATGDLLPVSLRLRKEVEALPEAVRKLRSEDAVRRVVDDLNARIAAWLRTPTPPHVPLAPVGVDEIIDGWRASRAAPAERDEPTEPASADAASPRRRRWWRRG